MPITPQAKPWFVAALFMGILATSHAPLPTAGRIAMGAALTVPLLLGWLAFHWDYYRAWPWESWGPRRGA